MNRNKLKTYAPQARRDFIQAVTDRAAQFGLSSAKIETMMEKGDVVLISGKPFPKSVGEKRKKLDARIKKYGFEQTIEAMAYTWFNRFVAIRFMELHGYLDHGFRVLSHPAGHSQPEILEHAQHVELAGLDQKQVIALKLDGNKEEELYRLLLLAQCNALHKALPFLFESLDDETELLLPDNLLHSDSLIRKLVGEIEEEDWKEVEIIGWLYQFYISEKKDEVIGKVVASEDIPAATQLFTPNWIVKYLVQNTIGRQWLATYPESSLRQKMVYYIEPAEQTPEVQEQLRAITPTSLNPTELTLLDPACGSGHILVEAYDLFKAIYEERGFRAKDIPALILEKNLFGLEIDDRAAQLASFALMMKARGDDRHIFESEAKPNIVAIPESADANATEIYFALTSPLKGELTEETPVASSDQLFETEDNLFTRVAATKTKQVAVPFCQADISTLVELFENAKIFGSLIQIPQELAAILPEIEKRLDNVLKLGNLTHASANLLKPILRSATLLASSYMVVVGNPPYMGGKYMTSVLKSHLREYFEEHTADLFAAFVARSLRFLPEHGRLGFMTPFVWMFLSSYEPLRRLLTVDSSIMSLVRPEYHAFFESAYVPICAFVVQSGVVDCAGTFIDLSKFYGEDVQAVRTLEAIQNQDCDWRFKAGGLDFKAVPGCPIAYWISKDVRLAFRDKPHLGDLASPRAGLATGDNNLFQREWYEVSFDRIGFNLTSTTETYSDQLRWFPCNSGGAFRKWYGNNETVVDWQNDGSAIRNFFDDKGKLRSRPQNRQFYFKPGVTWTKLSSSCFGARLREPGFVFDDTGRSAFPGNPSHIPALLAFMCSNVAMHFLSILSPTLSFTSGDVANIPLSEAILDGCDDGVALRAIEVAREDWDSREESWEFGILPLLEEHGICRTISAALNSWVLRCNDRLAEMRNLERANNEYFLHAYSLQDELSPEVPDDQITLYRPDREEDIKRLISYAIGCMMGRYSLDKPGLILASQGENLDSYLMKVSAQSESLHKDRILSELDRIELAEASVKCFGCGATSTIQEAKFVIAGETTKEGQLHGRPLIYCAKCCDHDRSSYVTMSMPLSQFSPNAALQQKWCEPETLEIFLDLAGCYGKRIPLRPEEVKFLPDEDGIIPLMEYSWFADDAANRFEKFIATAWPAEHMKENLDFVADSLGTKKGETAQETIRRYLATDFFKHHLSMYNKRPIYWLFSSGKQRGFQALVYLHRYNEGTLARMRTEYVVPLIGKMTARIGQLGDEIEATSASPRKKKLTTDKATITKQLAEVQAFEEKLRHYADQRIKLDLDDGVKVNYGKFGDLLAEVKAVCGSKEED